MLEIMIYGAGFFMLVHVILLARVSHWAHSTQSQIKHTNKCLDVVQKQLNHLLTEQAKAASIFNNHRR